MAQKKYLTVGTDKNGIKYIRIDDSVKPTAADLEDKAVYVAAGYIIRHKSEKRAKAATQRAETNSLSDEDILAALKNDASGLKKYKEIKAGKGKGSGFFAAKSWYKKYSENK